MAKKKKSKAKEKPILPALQLFIPEPKIHPSDDYEDPINGKYTKTIEITLWGPDWS
jgi:hypothetical protein